MNPKSQQNQNTQRELQQMTIDQLQRVRILNSKLIFVTNLAFEQADENLLKSKQFFGQYGKIQSLKIQKKYDNSSRNSINDFSVYVLFKKKKSAKLALLSLRNFKLNDTTIQSYFGFTRLCKHFLQNTVCYDNTKCQYLHSLNFEEPYTFISNKPQIKELSQFNLETFVKSLPNNLIVSLQTKLNKQNNMSIFPNHYLIIDKILKSYKVETQVSVNQPKQIAPETFSQGEFLKVKKQQMKKYLKNSKRIKECLIQKIQKETLCNDRRNIQQVSKNDCYFSISKAQQEKFFFDYFNNRGQNTNDINHVPRFFILQLI